MFLHFVIAAAAAAAMSCSGAFHIFVDGVAGLPKNFEASFESHIESPALLESWHCHGVFLSSSHPNKYISILAFASASASLRVLFVATPTQGLEISSFLDMKLKLNCQFNSKMVMKLNMNNRHYQLS